MRIPTASRALIDWPVNRKTPNPKVYMWHVLTTNTAEERLLAILPTTHEHRRRPSMPLASWFRRKILHHARTHPASKTTYSNIPPRRKSPERAKKPKKIPMKKRDSARQGRRALWTDVYCRCFIAKGSEMCFPPAEVTLSRGEGIGVSACVHCCALLGGEVRGWAGCHIIGCSWLWSFTLGVSW